MSEESTEKKPETEAKIEVKAESVASEKSIDAKPVETKAPAGDGDGASTSYSDRQTQGGNGNTGGYERRGGYGSYDRPRRMTDDEKFKRYKKQSEERLLDIKRSKEAKIGKRRGR